MKGDGAVKGDSTQLNRNDILDQLQKNQRQIRRFGVRRLALFGSVARGDNRTTSDIDFVVEFEKKSFDGYMDLKAYLEKILGCKVDLVINETIKPRLRPAILKEMVHAPGL